MLSGCNAHSEPVGAALALSSPAVVVQVRPSAAECTRLGARAFSVLRFPGHGGGGTSHRITCSRGGAPGAIALHRLAQAGILAVTSSRPACCGPFRSAAKDKSPERNGRQPDGGDRRRLRPPRSAVEALGAFIEGLWRDEFRHEVEVMIDRSRACSSAVLPSTAQPDLQLRAREPLRI